MAKTKQKEFDIPSNLSVTRKIDPSIGRFFALSPSGTLTPVTIREQIARGSTGTYEAGYGKTGTDLLPIEKAEVRKPSISRSERAFLPRGTDTLVIEYFLRVLGGLDQIDSNSREAREEVARLVRHGRSHGLIHDLAARYAWNIANGRTAWRNRLGSSVIVLVQDLDDGMEWAFDATKPGFRRFPGVEELSQACIESSPEAGKTGNADSLVKKIAEALSADAMGRALRLKVRLQIKLVPDAEVWPSQVLKPNDKESKRPGEYDVTKILYSVEAMDREGQTVRQAAMHTQKIGNALRCVDEWHGDEDHDAIAIEIYGFVQREQEAVRYVTSDMKGRRKNVDAYSLFKNMPDLNSRLETGTANAQDIGDAMFLLALLARGGVLTKSSKADNSTTGTTEGQGGE
jgi:CRISPR-associated protein Csy3